MILLAVIVLLGWLYCKEDEQSGSKRAVHIALEWNKFMLAAEVYTEGYRGPIAARTYGYVGLAAYEAALPGLGRTFFFFNGEISILKIAISPGEG
jgi:hypothetical protein